MEMIPVESSHIEAIGHDPATDTMVVQFNGGRQYRYLGILPDQFANLKASSSKGRHLRGMGVKGIKIS